MAIRFHHAPNVTSRRNAGTCTTTTRLASAASIKEYDMMTEQQLLKHCHFYKGEALPPFEQTDGRRLLWLAEKWICEEGNNLINPANPKREMASYIAAYVGKWAPFKSESIMELYFQKAPQLKAEISAIYN